MKKILIGLIIILFNLTIYAEEAESRKNDQDFTSKFSKDKSNLKSSNKQISKEGNRSDSLSIQQDIKSSCKPQSKAENSIKEVDKINLEKEKDALNVLDNLSNKYYLDNKYFPSESNKKIVSEDNEKIERSSINNAFSNSISSDLPKGTSTSIFSEKSLLLNTTFKGKILFTDITPPNKPK